MGVEPWEWERPNRLRTELVSWTGRLEPSDFQDARYQAAFETFDKALITTIEYMKDRENGHPEDQRRERELTRYWNEASQAISPLDPDLSDACMQKGLGWTDPKVWKSARKQGIAIGIQDMQDARSTLNKKRQSAMDMARVQKWFPIAGVCFAAVTVGFLMYLLLGPALGPEKKRIFDVLMAFCASASAAFLGGSAAAKGSLPFFEQSPDKIFCLWWDRYFHCRFPHPPLGWLKLGRPDCVSNSPPPAAPALCRDVEVAPLRHPQTSLPTGQRSHASRRWSMV